MNSADYAIDDIIEFSKESVEIPEEELSEIRKQFSAKTLIKKYRCKFSSTAIDRGITGTYDMIYAYVNKEWLFVSATPYDQENWIYSAKDIVSTKQIRDDLQTLDIPELNGEKIGKESDTVVEISERQSAIENGNDSMKVTVTYDAKFAIYKFNIKLLYQFKDGKWVMTSSSVDDQDFWEISFNDGMKPNEPKEAFIINELSNSSNYKNYMMNLGYIDNYYLTKDSETVNGNELSYNYVLIVTYNEFGDIEYKVSKKYIWTNNAWQEGDLSVSVKSSDWTKMIGTWASTNGDFIRFKNLENNILEGTYTHKYSDGDYVTYSITATINLELTDNNWDMMVEQGKVLAGDETDHFVILPFKVDLKDDVITSNGNIYISKGDEEGGDGFTINEDGSYYEDKPEEDFEIDHEDDYNSGLNFFEDEYEDVTNDSEGSEESDETTSSNDDSEESNSTDKNED